jgi:hypothetical protein
MKGDVARVRPRQTMRMRVARPPASSGRRALRVARAVAFPGRAAPKIPDGRCARARQRARWACSVGSQICAMENRCPRSPLRGPPRAVVAPGWEFARTGWPKLRRPILLRRARRGGESGSASAQPGAECTATPGLATSGRSSRRCITRQGPQVLEIGAVR